MRARTIRQAIVRKLRDGTLRAKYGLTVELDEGLRQVCVEDATGDSLDAVIAAVQTAWALRWRDGGYGVPEDCDVGEGWIVDPVTRPSVDSSITRVRPVFRALFESDLEGTSWLPQILELARDNQVARRIAASPGRMTPELLEKRWFGDRIQGEIELERTFEFSVPPSERFLLWLIEHPDRLEWPESGGRRAVFGKVAQDQREKLLGLRGDDGERSAIEDARQALRRCGVAGSAKQWWAFEGFTEVDCCIVTDRLVLLIERKRTEGLSESTAWYRGRNQLHRNLEAARELAGGREYAVIVIGEEPILGPDIGDPSVGLPHLTDTDRAELMTHYLGCLTWRQLCEATGVDWGALPRNVARRKSRQRRRSRVRRLGSGFEERH